MTDDVSIENVPFGLSGCDELKAPRTLKDWKIVLDATIDLFGISSKRFLEVGVDKANKRKGKYYKRKRLRRLRGIYNKTIAPGQQDRSSMVNVALFALYAYEYKLAHDAHIRGQLKAMMVA